MINKKRLYTPLSIVIGFNILTLLLFLFSPYKWYGLDSIFVTIYLIINYIFIFFGYKFGINRVLKKSVIKNLPLSTPTPVLIRKIFAFYSLTFLIKYAYLLRFQVFDISGMFSYLLIGVYDSQIGYELSINDNRPHTVSWILFILISIINQVFFIFGFISWKKLTFFFKVVFFIFLVLEIFYWIGRGTGFGIVVLITTFLTVSFIQSKIKVFNFKFLFIVFICSMLFGSFYGFLKNRRIGVEINNLQVFSQGLASVDENHFIFEILSEPAAILYMHNTSYITQGYYHLGLAMSLNTEFSSTYLLGNNPATLNIANNLGIDLWKDTYIYKLYKKKGISDRAKWHSGFLWYANDVSFYGVPLVMSILGVFLSMSYVFILKYDDLLSKIIFVIFMNMFIYLFANNTYLYHYFYTLLIFLPFWYFTRTKRI